MNNERKIKVSCKRGLSYCKKKKRVYSKDLFKDPLFIRTIDMTRSKIGVQCVQFALNTIRIASRWLIYFAQVECSKYQKSLLYTRRDRLYINKGNQPVYASYITVYKQFTYLEVKLPYDPVCPSVGRSVGWSVCHYFLKVGEVSLSFSYRSTCWQYLFLANYWNCIF